MLFPRSSSPTAVRCSPQASAKSSCDVPCFSRNSLMRPPSVSRISCIGVVLRLILPSFNREHSSTEQSPRSTHVPLHHVTLHGGPLSTQSRNVRVFAR